MCWACVDIKCKYCSLETQTSIDSNYKCVQGDQSCGALQGTRLERKDCTYANGKKCAALSCFDCMRDRDGLGCVWCDRGALVGLSVREFGHVAAACAKLPNGSDNMFALVYTCCTYGDVKQRVALPLRSINDSDLVLCGPPRYVGALAVVAVVPVVIGPGPEMRAGDERRVSAYSHNATRSKVRLVPPPPPLLFL